MRVVVTRIEQDGTMLRRVVDTALRSDCLQWEHLAGRALEFPPPYRPVPGIPIYHLSIGEQVILAAEHDLSGPLLNLVTAVMAVGEDVLTATDLMVSGWGASAERSSWRSAEWAGALASGRGEQTPDQA